MVDEAVPQPVLSIAGELLAINGQIIAAVELRVDPQLRQGADDWGNVLLELNLPGFFVLYERELPATKVRVDAKLVYGDESY